MSSLLLRNPKVNYRVQKTSLVDYVVKQFRPAHNFTPCSLRFILILEFHLRLGHAHFRLSDYLLLAVSPLP